MIQSFSTQQSFTPSYVLDSTRKFTTDNDVSQKSLQNNTFVHKLYNMVLDDQFQHLIAWNYTGISFIVCNILDFSREVLPKHFKHNNFSSFVRQLNMYGFHKVNKSPRGHRTLAENQIWEFSHSQFLKDQPHLLDSIKRKTLDSDVRRELDLQPQLNKLQLSQNDLIQQISYLKTHLTDVKKDLAETKQRQQQHFQLVKQCFEYINHQSQGQLPQKLKSEYEKLTINDVSTPTFIRPENQNVNISPYEYQYQQNTRSPSYFEISSPSAQPPLSPVGYKPTSQPLNQPNNLLNNHSFTNLSVPSSSSSRVMRIYNNNDTTCN